jgi:hypothetical protein
LPLIRLIFEQRVGKLTLKQNKITYPQSVITLDVMSNRVSADNIAECAVVEFEVSARIWERSKPHLRIVVKDGRILNVVRV